MNEKFFDLKTEKQNRIINASLKIFASMGYQKASTDDIVREAGISKGLLFHYFESKLGLYIFLYDYSIKFINLEITGALGPNDKEFFDVTQKVFYAGVESLRQYPYMVYFLETAKYEKNIEALTAVDSMKKEFEIKTNEMEAGLDFSKLKRGADYNMVKNYIMYTIITIMKKHLLEGSFNPDAFYEEGTAYINMLRGFVIDNEVYVYQGVNEIPTTA